MDRTRIPLLLFLLLSGCAAAYNAQHGTSRDAHCTVTNPAGAVVRIPVTAWGQSPTAYGNYSYPSRQLVGWEECFLASGTPIQILGAGDLEIGTSKVISLGSKQCVGNIHLADIGQCSGGETLSEAVFPFLKPVPVLRRY